MSKKYKPKFLINEEMVQDEAKSCLDRQLTREEIDDVFYAITDEWMMFVQDRIHYVIDFNEMLERNRGAEAYPIRFEVYHRNENAYKPHFVNMGSFRAEDDARAYARHDFITEYDEWQIFRVEGNEKREVWSINIK